MTGAAYAAFMVALDPRRTDLLLGVLTAVVVGVAVAADVRGAGAPPLAYLFAAGFGALMLGRRR